jgi:hypothetical protein
MKSLDFVGLVLSQPKGSANRPRIPGFTSLKPVAEVFMA